MNITKLIHIFLQLKSQTFKFTIRIVKLKKKKKTQYLMVSPFHITHINRGSCNIAIKPKVLTDIT